MLEFQLLVQLELRIFGGLLLQITTVNHIIMKKFLFWNFHLNFISPLQSITYNMCLIS